MQSSISQNQPPPTRLRPRSPLQTALLDPHLSSLPRSRSRSRPQLDYVQSSSGVKMQFPFVFPSAPSTRSPSLSTSLQTRTDTDDSEFETSLADDVDSLPDFSSAGQSYSSSPHAVSITRPSPQLHLDLGSLTHPANRRISTSSSYHRPSPDHLLLTPGTICLFTPGHPTSRSHHPTGDIFSEAFAVALKSE